MKHYRTKKYNPISLETIRIFKYHRKSLINSEYNKKSTEILVLTDNVNFGPTSNFIKTVQNNGALILHNNAGNPLLKEEDNIFLDSGVEPLFSQKYKDTEEYQNLKEKGFEIYSIPYTENFLTAGKKQCLMAFKVSKVDEKTKIYHIYENTYYNEFISEAEEIFDKYNNNSKCDVNNTNLILEDSNCIFEESDTYAHDGHPCRNNGELDKTKCKKSYHDIGYYYDNHRDKCFFAPCTNYENEPISESHQDVSPVHMKEVINNTKKLLNSYAFLDILKKPTNPYGKFKISLIEQFIT